MEMEKVFQITGYKEIRDGNATIWRRAVPRQSAKGLLAQFSNTRKTGGDGVTYPAFAPNVVMPSAKLFGRTAKTIVIDGKRYVVPSDVELREYVESDGTAYIIIPHKLNSTEKVNVKYMLTSVNTGATANCPFGVTSSADSADAKNGCVRTLDGLAVLNRVGYGNGDGTVYDIDGGAYKDLDTWYEAEYKPNGECYINSDLVATLPTSDWIAEYDFALFGRMTAGNVTFNAIGRIAHCIIGDSVKALPAIKNNVVGFWDAVTNAFFTPVGTLTAGLNRAVELYGVGDKTANLLDTSNSNLSYWGASNGNLSYYSDGSCHSYIIDIEKEGLSVGDVVTITCSSRGTASYWNIGTYAQIVDGQSAITYESTAVVTTKSVTIETGVKYIVVFNGSGYANDQMAVKGSTSSTSYIPYGYSVDVLMGQQGCVDFGTINCSKNSQEGMFSIGSTILGKANGNQNVYCAKYATSQVSSINDMQDMEIKGNGSSGAVYIKDIAAWNTMTAAEFKDAMSGIPLYFQRTTDASFIPPEKHTVILGNQLHVVGDYEDTFDWQNSTLTGKVGVKVLDGVDIGVENSKQGNVWVINASGKVATKVEIACSHFPYSTGSSSTAPDHTCISFASHQFGFRADEFSSATEVNNWLAEQYANGTPVTFCIPLATPTTTTKTVTPIALTEKGEHTLENTNLVKGDVQVECLSM